jgi:membrane AbrB-like protein
MIKSLASAAAALAIAACGGAVFFWLHTPLPWTLGALTAAGIVAAATGWSPLQHQHQVRAIVRPVVGVLAGSAFTAGILASMLQWWSAILLIVAYSLAMLFLGFFYFRRIARFDVATAFFASAPGGLGELSLIGGSVGANMRRLVVVHAIRILLVVFMVPFALQWLLGKPIGRTVPTAAAAVTLSGFDWAVLAACAFAGYGLSRVLRFPGGPMIFSMIFSVAVHASGLTHASPPPWLIATVQVALGAVVGARFAGIRWGEAGHAVLLGTIWGIIMLSSAVATAFVGTWMLDYSFEAMVLAMAPAGMVEMTLITLALGFDVAFVVTCQLCRVLFVLISTPALFGLLGVQTGKPTGGPPSS